MILTVNEALVLKDIKTRLRRSLNESGILTLDDLIGSEHAPLLSDLPVPESLFQPGELSSNNASVVEPPADEETITAVEAPERSCVESSPLSSRNSDSVLAGLANESTCAVTNRVQSVKFNTNFREVPCLRVNPGDQPEVVALKQTAMANLQKRLDEAIEK
ncbi:unnamed protein product [Gongylonema pulchrum]|uniref:Uncharacterized protein n=1 Tax=Gongylonema pulchrum TaxID=637853 RepID=A0A183EVQ2_9BILA|nr:unnamed protein product [Gongylonema pulchrum]